MFIKYGDDYGDVDFFFLSEHLALLDHELSQITSNIKNSRGPDSDGLFDRGEYFIGSGFAAIQRYITSTYPQTKIAREKALKLGPKINDDLTLAEAINAGANYWKHLEEWGLDIIVRRDIDSLKKPALGTISTIEKATPWDDYTCANLLAALVEGGELKLSLLLPQISDWRQHLDKITS